MLYIYKRVSAIINAIIIITATRQIFSKPVRSHKLTIKSHKNPVHAVIYYTFLFLAKDKAKHLFNVCGLDDKTDK